MICLIHLIVCLSVCLIHLSVCMSDCLFVCLFEHLQKIIRLDAKKNTLLLVKERGNGMQIDRYLGRFSERKGKERKLGRERMEKEIGIYTIQVGRSVCLLAYLVCLLA